MYISSTFQVSFKVILNEFHLRSEELGLLVINPNIVIELILLICDFLKLGVRKVTDVVC